MRSVKFDPDFDENEASSSLMFDCQSEVHKTC